MITDNSKYISSLLNNFIDNDLFKLATTSSIVVTKGSQYRLDLVLQDNGVDLRWMKFIQIYNGLRSIYDLYEGSVISIPDISELITKLNDYEEVMDFEI